MALRYKIVKVKNSRLPEDQSHYSISLVRSSNITLDQLGEEMNALSAFSPGDLTGLVDNLILLVSNHLVDGDSVTLDGFGTFSVSAGLKDTVTDPANITGNDIRIKRICFKPSPGFKRRVERKASFEKFRPVLKIKGK